MKSAVELRTYAHLQFELMRTRFILTCGEISR